MKRFTYERQVSIGHVTVIGGNEAGVDIVLIQPFLLYYVNHVFLIETGIFKHNFHKKRKEVCIKTRSTSGSHSLKGWDSKLTTVKWSIRFQFVIIRQLLLLC